MTTKEKLAKVANMFVVVFFAFMCAVILAILICGYIRDKKEDKLGLQRVIETNYEIQNQAFPRIKGAPDIEAYSGYEWVREPQLFVYLYLYSEYIRAEGLDAKELTFEDIKDYLSSEYNEDGTLRIYTRYRLTLLDAFKNYTDTENQNVYIDSYNHYKGVHYENYIHIYDYVNWFWQYGEELSDDYFRDLMEIAYDYYDTVPDQEYVSPYYMSIPQLQELMSKKNDPTYEINEEIMLSCEK